MPKSNNISMKRLLTMRAEALQKLADALVQDGGVPLTDTNKNLMRESIAMNVKDTTTDMFLGIMAGDWTFVDHCRDNLTDLTTILPKQYRL